MPTERIRTSAPPAASSASVTVVPDSWPPILQALFLQLQAMLGAMSPAWLLVLAVPAVLAARRA